MRKSRKNGLRPFFAFVSLALFIYAFPCLLAAQEQSLSQAQDFPKNNPALPRPETLKLGLGLFFPLSLPELENLVPGEISLDALGALALERGEGALSVTFPGILARRLEPLGFYHGQQRSPGEDSEASLEFAAKAKDDRFYDPRIDLDAIRGLGGYAAGLYSQTAKGLEILLLYYEKGSSEPAAYYRKDSSIGELERLNEFFLARIISWISGRNLSVFDLETKAFGKVSIEGPPGEDSSYFVQDSRVFLFTTGPHVFTIAAEGYEDNELEIENPAPFTYRLLKAPLRRLAGPVPAQDFRESSKVLEWKEEEAFKKAKTRFSAALGRFLISLPVSVLSVGNFASVQEAYLRYAKPESAYYGSGAFAGFSIALSLGFTVDTVVALVDLLRLSR
jgi:hypothetical protein